MSFKKAAGARVGRVLRDLRVPDAKRTTPDGIERAACARCNIEWGLGQMEGRPMLTTDRPLRRDEISSFYARVHD